jgi:hypothetical protein
MVKGNNLKVVQGQTQTQNHDRGQTALKPKTPKDGFHLLKTNGAITSHPTHMNLYNTIKKSQSHISPLQSSPGNPSQSQGLPHVPKIKP